MRTSHASRNSENVAHDHHGKFVLVLFDKLIVHLDSREKMLTTSDRISQNLLILARNLCTLMSGEAQLGRSQLEKVPQNPATALELDS